MNLPTQSLEYICIHTHMYPHVLAMNPLTKGNSEENSQLNEFMTYGHTPYIE